MPEDEEISIDFSKIKGWFKHKKKKEETDSEFKSGDKSEKEQEFHREEGKLGIEIDNTPPRPEKKPEKHKEIAGVEVEKEDKIFVIEKERKEADNKDEDEISFDFSKIKDSFKNIFKRKDKQEKIDIFKEKSEDDLSLDLKGIENFFKKNKKWLVPIVLILIAISFSTYFRTAPQRLPATDDWAENSVYNYYKNQIASQINQQYPNLPAANKNNLINQEFAKFLESNKDMMDQQIEATSQQFKNEFKDDAGQTYLLAIDPYLWYGEARNYINHGHFGTDVVDGKDINFLRNGREGKPGEPGSAFHLYFEVYLYKFVHLFTGASLMFVVFYVPVIIIGLSLIPAFLIGRKITGNIGGFFAAMVVAINGALLSRTPAGFADTDAYNIFFPLLIMWLFLESLDAEKLRDNLIYAALAGLSSGLYSAAWGGWWYAFGFALLTSICFVIFNLIKNYSQLKDGFVNYLINSSVKNSLVSMTSFFIFSGIFVSLFSGFRTFISSFEGPFEVISLKSVATASIWPNVLTTVAEFNEVPFGTIISQMGGKILFFLALLGIILTIIKKNIEGKRDVEYAIFLVIWFAGTLYGFTKGIRFGILMVPAFAIAFGAGVGIIYEYLSAWLHGGLKVNKIISKSILIVLICLLLIPSVITANNTARNEIPSMNDAWWNSLTKIKDSTKDAIITSWWDFGHWFVTVAERRVTFDGADQGERIHWVGKSLLTPDENISVGLLRMLNCGQEKSVHVLEEFFEGNAVKAVDVLNKMMVLNDKEKAIKLLNNEGLTSKQINEIIKITYCDDLIEQFYITSQDMVGKAGVWGHFGSWDFAKAERYFLVHDSPKEKGIKILMNRLNFTEEEAEERYDEIQSVDNADSWVSSWPNYMSGLNPCKRNGNFLECPVGTGNGVITFEIDLKTMDTNIVNIKEDKKPYSIVYATKDKIKEKMFKGATTDFSVVLVPQGENYGLMLTHPLQARSMFTQLFFFKGHGLECFDLFDERRQITSEMIYVYKIDFDCQGKNRVFFLPQEEIKASHILIGISNRTDEEALKLINEIQKKITKTNFGDLAKKYSEDPGSAVRDGDLGWFGKGVMVSEFEIAAFSLKKGEVSGPIKTQFGYHLIKLIDKREIDVEDIPKDEPEIEKVVVEETDEIIDNMSGEVTDNNSELIEEENNGKVFEISI